MSRLGVVLLVLLIVGAAALGSPGEVMARDSWRWPLSGTVSLEYGARYANDQGRSCSHGGVDVAAVEGATVSACAGGEVTFAGLVPAGVGRRAWAVTVLTADGLHVTYLPLARTSVVRGESVDAGEALGELSDYGDASSPATHLHLGVRRGERALDPLTFLAAVEAAVQPGPEPAPVARQAATPSRTVPRAGSVSAAHGVVSGSAVAVAPAPSSVAVRPATPSLRLLASSTTAMPALDGLRRIAPLADAPRIRVARCPPTWADCAIFSRPHSSVSRWSGLPARARGRCCAACSPGAAIPPRWPRRRDAQERDRACFEGMPECQTVGPVCVLWSMRHGATLRRLISCPGPLPSQSRGRISPREVNQMKAYEAMLLIDPSLDEESHAAVVEKATGIITAQGGTLDSTEEWGKRRLAYEVKGFTDGAYTVVQFHASPAAVAELDRVLHITDPVARFMIVRRDDLD